MIGDHYFSTGITITPESGKWHISANFASSTEGEMHLRYLVDDPVEGAKTLKEDMEALGIQFGIKEIHPSVYFPGDSDNPDFPKYVETVNKVCEALGWPNIYKKRHSIFDSCYKQAEGR